MVELFGGIYEDALSVENMEYFAEALKTADVKKQKQLLRIIKRLLSSNEQPSDFIGDAQVLIVVLQQIINSSDSSNAESAAVRGLALEIVAKFGLAK